MHFLSGKGKQFVRFVTPTEKWAERVDDKLCVPSQWPLMLIDLLVEEGEVLLSSVLGVSARTGRNLAFQGIYRYSFDDLPEDVVAAIEQHFHKARVELRGRTEALLANVTKPRLTLVKR